MRFWFVLGLIYLFLLTAGLVFPVLGRLDSGSETWLVTTLNLLAVGALLLGPMVITILTARSLFPSYWWLAHVENKDIYEYDGVYFIGGRTTRQQARLTRLVFGMDDKMRRWHLVFGLLSLALMVPHLMAGYTAWRYAEGLAPNRPVLQESMHLSLLSALPVMQNWNRPWTSHSALDEEVHKALGDASRSSRQDPAQWFLVAQLRMLKAFQPRKTNTEPFIYSPGDAIAFHRPEGAQSVASLKRILDQPEAARKGWTRGALALTGFFHFSDQNPRLGLDFFQRALATVEQSDRTGISRHMIVLLAAQAALGSHQPPLAEKLLERLLAENDLPEDVYARAAEHFAAALQQQGHTERVSGLLAKALKAYKNGKNRAGIARVHLRMAVLALEQGRAQDASHDLSLAASLANGLDDGFTLNMVQGLEQYFPRFL